MLETRNFMSNTRIMPKAGQIFFPVPTRLAEAMPYRVHAAGRSVISRAFGSVTQAFHQNTLILTHAGAGRIEVGPRSFLAQPGSLAWLDTSRPYAHSSAGRGEWHYSWLGLSGHGLDRMFGDLGFAEDPVAEAPQTLSAAFASALAAIEHPDHLADARISLAVSAILLALAEARSHRLESQGEDRVTALLRQLRMAPHEAWTIARMASQTGLSQAQLFRRFRLATGRSPMQWLRQERIERARQRLLATSDKTASIARDCGYGDPFHFSRDFKRVTGLSPRQWRQGQAAPG